MDVHEMAEKLRNNKDKKDIDLYNEAADFCVNEVDIDLNDKDSAFLCDYTAKVILKMRLGKINENEAKFLAKYFAKVSARQFLIDDNIEVETPDEKEYKEKYGDITGGICTNNFDNTFKIVYSPTTIKNLMSTDPATFLRGMRTIFHEVGHAKQNTAIQNETINGVNIGLDKKLYIMALETLARNVDSKFYNEHYAHLFKENSAEKIGLREAMKYLEKYAPHIHKYYNQDWVQTKIEEYDKDFYDAKFEVNGKDVELFKKIETFASDYIEKHPEALEQYPILSVGYHKDGTKKDIIELIEDRQKALKECETEEDKERIDELYELIANHRNTYQIAPDELKNELIKVTDYINETGTDDEFVFGIFKNRVSKSNVSEEKKQDTIDKMYKAAKAVREKKKRESNSVSDKIEDIDEKE